MAKRDWLRALSLLTTCPVRPDWDDPAPLGRAMVWYPVVGLLLGVILSLTAGVLHQVAGGERLAVLRAALGVLVWVALTGGLHLDGWADSCDGLLVTADRDRRLEILRDPRVGSFGVTGLVLLLLVKVAAAAALSWSDWWLVPVLGRWVILPLAAAYPSARPGGLGDRFRAGLDAAAQSQALALTVACALLAGWRGLVALAVAFLASQALARFAHRRLGGLTGDIYGAAVELSETVALVVLAVTSRS